MLNKEQIMEILPHRPPMLLVDEILEMDENHVVGALHLTGDEFFFQGHFPGNPIMPAVFRLEALAQAGGVALLSLPEFKGKTAVYTGIDKAKFRAMGKAGRYPSSGGHLHQAPRPDGSSRGHRLGWGREGRRSGDQMHVIND